MKIVLNSTNAIPAEKTAARELTTYLEKITGAKFEIIEEKDLPKDAPAIYLGVTKYAEAQGIDFSKLSSEESILRTAGKDLILTGGRPRGTLYAVYDFLENDLGCRWYTAWYEKVPQKTKLEIPTLDRRVKPYFMYRDAYTWLTDPRMYADHAGWMKYLSRNRVTISPDGSPLMESLGVECVYGGRVGGGHGFAPYLPADKYFKEHPEYYSMRNGKRVPSNGLDGNHACLTDPDVLRIIVEEVKADIRKTPGALCYTVAVNDGGCKTICDCDECRKIARQYGATERPGTDTGLLIWFVNKVAESVKKEFPDKYIRTLIYGPAGALPKGIRCNDNVIIQICATPSAEWSAVSKNIWQWMYTDQSRRGYYVRPILWQIEDELKLAPKLGITGMFNENEFLAGSECLFYQFYEMSLWVYFKLCQNPELDVDRLVNDYLEGYYGKAAPFIRSYLSLLKERRKLYPFRLFDYSFANQSQTYFDQAEAAVAGSSDHLARVKDARLQLDLSVLALRNSIINNYLLQPGAALEKYPYPRSVLKQRLLATIQNTAHPLLRTVSPHYKMDDKGNEKATFEPVIPNLQAAIQSFCAGKEFVPLPDQFRRLPSDRVVDLTGSAFGINPYGSSPTSYDLLKDDPEAADEIAYARMGSEEFPLPVGIWNNSDVDDPEFEKQQREFLKLDQSGQYVDWPQICRTIKTNDIPSSGYHLYEGPKFQLRPATVFYVTKSWQFGQSLSSLFNSGRPQEMWAVYLSVKFTGPAYPYGKPDEPNAVYIDRIILIRKK